MKIHITNGNVKAIKIFSAAWYNVRPHPVELHVCSLGSSVDTIVVYFTHFNIGPYRTLYMDTTAALDTIWHNISKFTLSKKFCFRLLKLDKEVYFLGCGPTLDRKSLMLF